LIWSLSVNSEKTVNIGLFVDQECLCRVHERTRHVTGTHPAMASIGRNTGRFVLRKKPGRKTIVSAYPMSASPCSVAALQRE
jgi:hypothetical protein